jgi:putative zinc finger/helix-turn-helix YgiT family protein
MREYLCGNCNFVDESKTKIETRLEKVPVKGEDTEITSEIRVCSKCGEDIFDEKLEEKNLGIAYDIYRKKHNLLFPGEIKAIREKYSLSQNNLAKLLGWGEVTLSRYENGSLPEESHNNLLKLIEDPFNMKRLLDENPTCINEKSYKKVSNKLEEMLLARTPGKIIEVVSISNKKNQPGLLTGYTIFRPELLMEMIMFFAAKPGGVLKTKLNKLLWYRDFSHFLKYKVSISGATYIHLPFGPVPDNYELFLYSLSEQGSLTHIEQDFGNGFIGEKFIAEREVKKEVFSLQALAVLEGVYRLFDTYTSKGISEISHKEIGYIKTKTGEPISYAYAGELLVCIP